MNKNIKNIFNKWISITTEIYQTLPNVPVLACPSCHQLRVDFQFVGDLPIKIGFMVIWCPYCLRGINLSRVNIPESAQVISFYTSIEEISKRIPNFTHIKP